MVDYEMRVALKRDVRKLVAGRMNLGEFDDAFYFRYSLTDDQGVRQIAALCHSLYANDSPPAVPTRHTIESVGIHDMFVRSILFLQSELEYEWPGEPLSLGRRTMAGIAVFMVLPILMSMLFFAFPLAVATTQAFIAILVMTGIGGLLWAVYLVCRPPIGRLATASDLPRGSNYDVWPFLRQCDLNQMVYEFESPSESDEAI